MIAPIDSDIGRRVVYRGFDFREYGKITSFNDKVVFVRYDLRVLDSGERIARFGETAEGTRREDLEWEDVVREVNYREGVMMRRALRSAFFLCALLAASIAGARGHHYSHRTYVSRWPFPHHAAVGVLRDSRGRIARSSAVRREFLRLTGYPNGRPGWIVDHVTPLQCGGADAVWNMQWESAADARAKDRTEAKCGKW